jgi:phytoene desaturase
MFRKRIAIIGSGLGALATVAYLSNNKSNLEIIIFEKNPAIGGKIGEIAGSGFRFDTGPSLLTMPYVFKDLFKVLGTTLEEQLNLIKLEPICRYFFPSNKVLDSSHQLELFSANIKNLSPEHLNDSKALSSFINYSREIFEFAEPIFLASPFRDEICYKKTDLIKALLKLSKLDSLTTMYNRLNKVFITTELKQLFSRYATYSGSSPYLAPATLNLIPHVEYNLGSYYIKGGIKLLVNKLINLLTKQNIEFRPSAEVTRIIYQNNQVTGIKLVDGTTIMCDAVICNGDVDRTYNRLLNIKLKYPLQRKDSSTSAYIFLWGVNAQYSELKHHNIFFSEDYCNEFDDLFRNYLVPKDPTVYLNITSKSDFEDAPLNCENWFVMINAPALPREFNNISVSYEEVKSSILKKLEKQGFPLIRDQIIYEKVITPINLENNFYSPYGSIYGRSSNSKWSAFLRHPNGSKKIRGLFFAGGSVHPGGGMPLVVLSGKHAAGLAVKYLDR